MMPSRSPAWTSRLTARTAVRPPKRLVTDSSVSTVPPRTPPRGDARHAFRREPHDEDQHDAVDDQVDAGEARLDAGEGRAQVRLERGDEQRAEERPQRGAHAADDAVEREADGESIEKTCDGSTKPTYCAHRLPPMEVRAALTTTACTLRRRVAMPSASAASSSSRTPASW